MLEVLRQMTKDGKLPPEDVVAKIEATFPKSRTGALARLLRGRIRYENKDYNGAAEILGSNCFPRENDRCRLRAVAARQSVAASRQTPRSDDRF